MRDHANADLAETIASSPGLRFGGLMTYPATGGAEAAAAAAEAPAAK